MGTALEMGTAAPHPRLSSVAANHPKATQDIYTKIDFLCRLTTTENKSVTFMWVVGFLPVH